MASTINKYIRIGEEFSQRLAEQAFGRPGIAQPREREVDRFVLGTGCAPDDIIVSSLSTTACSAKGKTNERKESLE